MVILMKNEEILFTIYNYIDNKLIYYKNGKVYVGKELLTTLNDETNAIVNNYIKENLLLFKKFNVNNEDTKNKVLLKINYNSRKYKCLLIDNKQYIKNIMSLILNKNNWK